MYRSTCVKILLLFALALTTACNSQKEVAPTEVAQAATPIPRPSNTPAPAPTIAPRSANTPTATWIPSPPPPPTATPTPAPEAQIIVTDSQSGKPASGVLVELSGPMLGDVLTQETDSAGAAYFELPGQGPFTISLSGPGYLTLVMLGVKVIGQAEFNYALTPLFMAEVTVETATVRHGPGEVYDAAGTCRAGDVFAVVGQNEASTWYLVTARDEDNVPGDVWVAAEAISLTGNMENVAIVDAPPTPTPAPTAAPTAIPPTATPAVVDFITIFYLSNPNEVLGVFPVKPFDPNEMYNNMLRMRSSIFAMRDALPGTLAGDSAACGRYASAYATIMNSGVFYNEVPGEWQDIDLAYFVSFVYALDRTRPAYLSCRNSGKVDQFNHDLARLALDQTLEVLNPATAAAASRLGR